MRRMQKFLAVLALGALGSVISASPASAQCRISLIVFDDPGCPTTGQAGCIILTCNGHITCADCDCLVET